MKNGPKLSFERRMSPRVELKGLTGLPDKPDSVRIVDLSANGAQVEFHSRLVPGNMYEMKLTFPDRQILARAQVTRSIDLRMTDNPENLLPEAVCLAGLKFQGLSTEDSRYLEHYVAVLADSKR